jgi:hypothetical protein
VGCPKKRALSGKTFTGTLIGSYRMAGAIDGRARRAPTTAITT